ncbi:hypothetical protein WR25_10229 [Diploscapter pachys]|uniref:Uncharacterized protein n=1 Tax=Diploscapter pachys TaxID=2018661 RepID=A0A2A2L5M2_9BILA|nr:hypothetical protein WR25_10229 [Diploscapter pachys]
MQAFDKKENGRRQRGNDAFVVQIRKAKTSKRANGGGPRRLPSTLAKDEAELGWSENQNGKNTVPKMDTEECQAKLGC